MFIEIHFTPVGLLVVSSVGTHIKVCKQKLPCFAAFRYVCTFHAQPRIAVNKQWLGLYLPSSEFLPDPDILSWRSLDWCARVQWHRDIVTTTWASTDVWFVVITNTWTVSNLFELFLHKCLGVLSDHLLMEYDYLIRKGIGKGKVHPRTGLEGSEGE